jgi:hypothetical protein
METPRSAGFTPRALGPKSELVSQRGLDARPIEDFPLDLRGLHSLVADELDLERFLIIRPDMPEGADELARLHQKLPFERLQCLGVIGKIRPVGLLPVPRHEL